MPQILDTKAPMPIWLWVNNRHPNGTLMEFPWTKSCAPVPGDNLFDPSFFMTTTSPLHGAGVSHELREAMAGTRRPARAVPGAWDFTSVGSVSSVGSGSVGHDSAPKGGAALETRTRYGKKPRTDVECCRCEWLFFLRYGNIAKSTGNISIWLFRAVDVVAT